MLKDFWFEAKLSKLQKNRDRVEKFYAAKMHNAFQSLASIDEKEKIINSKQGDLDECDDDINALITGHLLTQAKRMFVQVPEWSDKTYWFESSILSGKCLTPAGVTKLRNDIRAEKKARWETFQSHAALMITLFTALTGALGAVIGVLSFLRKP